MTNAVSKFLMDVFEAGGNVDSITLDADAYDRLYAENLDLMSRFHGNVVPLFLSWMGPGGNVRVYKRRR